MGEPRNETVILQMHHTCTHPPTHTHTSICNIVRRIPATILVGVVMFCIGLASALDINILVNQDTVWAYAMILSGCLLIFMVLRYGPLRFRKTLFNEYGIGDWPLPLVWIFVVL